MALVNNATTIGTGGQNLVLETAGHIYIKVNERYYELDFKNSGSEKLYGKPIVNEVVQPTEEVDLSDYITNDDLKKALKKYVTEKSWQDVMDTQSALQNSLLDFEEAIKPITVQTMQVVVGSEELQFDWIYSFTKTKGPNNSFVDSPLYIDMDESSTHYNQLVWNPGYIKHYTFDGPEIVRPEDSLGSSYSDDQLKKYWRWYIKNSEGNDELEEINMDGTFYVYLKVPHSSGYNKEGLDSLKSLDSSSSSESSESSNNSDIWGNGIHHANLDLDKNGMPLQLVGTGIYAKTGIGQVVYSSEAIKFGPEHDETTGLNYYYLLYAIVTNSDGSPSISTLNGFTEILPGQIRAYIFATPAGDQYLDFLHGKFRIGSDTEYLEWNGTNLNIKGGISVTGGELKTELEKFQSPTDNEIECWFSDDGATNNWDLPLPNGDNEDNIKATPNWPVSTWGDNHAEHLGDFYYVVADNSNTTNINEKGLAYRYIKKDDKYYWDKVSDHSISKELYKVYQAKETADQALEKFSDWAADGVISPLEVTDIETEYNFIINDYKEQSYKATSLNLKETTEWTNYNTAYNNYKTSLEKVFTWWNGIKSDPNTRIGTYPIPNDFQTNLEAYYSARSTFINLAFKNSTADVSYITAAIKKGRTDITGGLVMTGLIELGFGLTNNPDDANYYDSFRVMSGINGICIKKDDNGNYDYTDPAVWFGGNNLDLENEADMNKPETCLLFIQKSDNTYNKYAKSDSTVVGTLYKWMKDDGTNYYSLDKDGDKLVHWSDSGIPLSSITLPSGVFKYSYSQLIQKTFTSPLSFGDSAGNQQILYGTIKAYLLPVINNNSYTVYNVLTKVTETLTGTFNSYIVQSHTSPGTIDLSKQTIITYTPTDSTSISGFIFSLDDTLPLHYISYTNLIPTKENGFLYTFGSSSMMIIDVYKYIGTETYQLYKWTNDSGSIYTLDDYLTKPKYVYSYSSTTNIATYLKNYTVADHFINWAKAMFRMNGSGYLANGNISWDKEGTLKIGESMTINSNGIIDLGYLHSGQSSFWIGTKSNKMLEVANNTCTINGSLRARAKDYYSGSFVSIEDSSGTMIADIGSTPLSTGAIPTYLRQTDDVGVFNAKGSVMYGAVNIPEGWEYQLIPWYYCYTDNELYKINYFNLEYSFARVSKEIKLTIILRKSDGIVNTDTEVFTKTFNVSKSTQSGKITITNLSYAIRETGISLEGYFGYSLFMTLSPGQVKSGIKSDSHIIIRRGPCEAQITQTSASIKKGTYIRPNGISSVFGQNCKFQWLGAMGLDDNNRFNKDYNYCDEGGTFIVTIPSIENGGTAKNVVGLEITGYRDSSGKPVTPGISINLGDGWHKLKIEDNTLKIVN